MSEAKVLNELRKSREKTEAVLEEDFEKLREDVSQLAETLRKLSGQIASQAVAVGKNKIETVSDEVHAATARAKKKAAAASEELEETVASNPFTSILISVGIGMLISQIMRR